jgi:hypothetical protein
VAVAAHGEGERCWDASPGQIWVRGATTPLVDFPAHPPYPPLSPSLPPPSSPTAAERSPQAAQAGCAIACAAAESLPGLQGCSLPTSLHLANETGDEATGVLSPAMPAPRDTARDSGSVSGSNTPSGGESSTVPYYYRPWYVTAAQEATASAGAGMFVDSIFYGLDSYKTHLQSRGGGPQQLGLTEIRGLFRGFLPVVASGSAPSFATFFALYVHART